MRSNSGSNRDLQELFHEFLHGCAKFLLGVGAIAMLGSIGLLVFGAIQTSGNPSLAADALRNAAILKQVVLVATIAVGVGSSFLFWGEEILGAVQLILAGALFFAPLYLDSLLGNSGEVKANAFAGIQSSGSILGLIGTLVLVADLSKRAKDRLNTGTKADQLKYGKSIKQEDDRQNVFLGKCWQLPYCRKFVREKCPIYHARVSCWKERVGCMCEEEVIRNAMAGKAIPKDQLLASKYIPRNNKLTADQKKERCRQCVIYNEHQKHKYRALLPTIMLAFGGTYVAFRQPLLDATGQMIMGVNRLVAAGTLGAAGKGQTSSGPFMEFLLICMFIVGLSYALKMLEFFIFRAKI